MPRYPSVFLGCLVRSPFGVMIAFARFLPDRPLIKNADGTVVGASKVAPDITARKRAQEQKTLLLFEMKHRIKNTLATLQAISNQTLRSTSADERIAFSARLRALGATYDLLTSDQWNVASLAEVVGAALHPFQQTIASDF
jgi:hypothetical protein